MSISFIILIWCIGALVYTCFSMFDYLFVHRGKNDYTIGSMVYAFLTGLLFWPIGVPLYIFWSIVLIAMLVKDIVIFKRNRL